MKLIPGLHRQHFTATRFLLLGSTFGDLESKQVSLRPAAVSSQKNRSSIWIKRVSAVLTFLMMTVALGLAAVIYGPWIYNQVVPIETTPIISEEQFSPLGGSFAEGTTVTQTEEVYQPSKDESLPVGEWVIIPRIGVRTELLKTANSSEALDKGVWWVPDFGSPGDQNRPMILVAHRFGYNWWWRSDYWKYHSFYLLPELEPGDIVEVIADQRKWTYEIYAGEEGEQITDYQADLILYTCKYLNSKIRHFRYARLINPDGNTQQISGY